MKPWTAEELSQVEDALADRVAGMLAPGEKLFVEGRSSEEEMNARIVLSGSDKGDRLELEARVEMAGAGLSEDEARDLALDSLDLVLLEYLESERSARFSGVFEERELRGHVVTVRAERTYPALEAAADALLADKPDAKG